MRNKLLFLSVIAVFVAMVGVSGAWAGHGMQSHGMSCCKGQSGMQLDKKFMKMAHMLIMNSDELGITDEQMAKIKDIKKRVMKDIITKKAEADVIKVDICSSLWEDTIDAEAVNMLVEKKYETKKALTKEIVKAIAELKGLLTDEQKTKMKKFCNEKKCR